MNKRLTGAKALVERLSRESAALREREIIAPLLPGGKIQTRLDKLVYEFKPRGRHSGWVRFRPVNEREAEWLGEAMPWQRAGYLELFPALRVVLLWPADLPAHKAGQKIWWALPYNSGDARQRFGFKPGEMLPVFLTEPLYGAERFEIVLARVEGKRLWFDAPDPLSDPLQAEWLRDAANQPEAPERFLPGLAASQRTALLFWQLRRYEQANSLEMKAAGKIGPRQQQELAESLARRHHLEAQLQQALAKADATLHSYSEQGGHLLVEWSEQGQQFRYRSVIGRELEVVSSGICLSGRDSDFDLTSLVSVMNRVDQDDW